MRSLSSLAEVLQFGLALLVALATAIVSSFTVSVAISSVKNALSQSHALVDLATLARSVSVGRSQLAVLCCVEDMERQEKEKELRKKIAVMFSTLAAAGRRAKPVKD